jgi:hypothetical protein
MSKPLINHEYTLRGYTFRVDAVEGGEVYAVRWPEGSPMETVGDPFRVPLETWEREMVGASVVKLREAKVETTP